MYSGAVRCPDSQDFGHVVAPGAGRKGATNELYQPIPLQLGAEPLPVGTDAREESLELRTVVHLAEVTELVQHHIVP